MEDIYQTPEIFMDKKKKKVFSCKKSKFRKLFQKLLILLKDKFYFVMLYESFCTIKSKQQASLYFFLKPKRKDLFSCLDYESFLIQYLNAHTLIHVNLIKKIA